MPDQGKLTVENKDECNKNKNDGLKSDINSIECQIKAWEEAVKTPPKNDGADYLEAILKVTSSLRESGDGNAIIIVQGSGLSDTGSLNFSTGQPIQNKIETTINRLKLNDNKHPLDGMKIYWLNACEVADGSEEPGKYTQQQLRSNTADKVKEVYKAVLFNLGAEEVKFVYDVDNRKAIDTTKKVVPTPVEILDGDILFKNDLPEFKNRERAVEELRAYIGYSRLTIKGYVARKKCSDKNVPGKIDNVALDRANAVKDILIKELNYDKKKIIVEAVGYDDNNYECPNNKLDKEIQAQNRKVVIL